MGAPNTVVDPLKKSRGWGWARDRPPYGPYLHIHPGYLLHIIIPCSMFHAPCARASVLQQQQLTCGRPANRRPTLPICAGALQGSDFCVRDHRFSTSSHRFYLALPCWRRKLSVRIATAREDGQRRYNKGPPLQLLCRTSHQICRHGRLHVPLLRRRVPRCQGRHPLPRDLQLLGAHTRPNSQLSAIARHPVANSHCVRFQDPFYNSSEEHPLPDDEFDNFLHRRVCHITPKHSREYQTDRRSLSILQGVFAPPDRQRPGTQLLSGVRLM